MNHFAVLLPGAVEFQAGSSQPEIFQEQPMAGKEIYHKMKDKVTGNER